MGLNDLPTEQKNRFHGEFISHVFKCHPDTARSCSQLRGKSSRFPWDKERAAGREHTEPTPWREPHVEAGGHCRACFCCDRNIRVLKRHFRETQDVGD